jgi:alpha-2-macroglobulin
MKKLPWKKLAIGAAIVVVIVTGIFVVNSSKGSKTSDTYVDPAFGQFISSYTAGAISSGSTISIVLAEEAVDSTLVGQETSVTLFDFQPSVSGKTVWVDKRTVEFRPEKRLISGQTYEVNFYLSKLLENIPSTLKTFEYTFQVIPLNFEVSIDNVKPYVKTDLKRQKIEGNLFTSDYADNEAVEKMLAAQQDGNALKVTWSHLAEGKQHSFVIEEVQRKEQASKVDLTVDGKSLDVEQRDEREIEIPALGDFKVTNVRVEQSSTQHIVVQFSDPLNEKQNLAGLISLPDVGTLDFEVRDNEIRVYPPARQTGSKTITIETGVRNVLNYRLKEGGTYDVLFEQMNPAVRFTGNGTILPSSDGLILPFEAVNLKSVDVQILKIYETNVLQFLQVNRMDGTAQLRRVGKPILKKTISLENSGVTDLGRWNRFTLDLSSMISTEPGAIYQVHINFRKSFAIFSCTEGTGTNDDEEQSEGIDDEQWAAPENEDSYWEYAEEYYNYGEDYDYQQRDNPCHNSYYIGDKSIKKNVLASDLGILSKRGGDGNTLIFVNDLKTTQPLSGVNLELYDYQQQVIGTASTGTDGKAMISSKISPFAIVAKNGSQRGYLRMVDGESVSISNFDVGGERISKGLKGFIYGERGVWRPGDSLFMTFILEDKMKLLPPSHPVVFELQNPQGQVTSRLVRSEAVNGFYKFATATAADAPTGNWMARVKVGGTEFSQPVRIEMVKPNRLKINLDFGVKKITAGNNNVSGTLVVNWLHGAPGRSLRAEFEVLLTKGETKFDRYPDFAFEDPSRDFSSEAQKIYEGSTDDEGRAVINATLEPANTAPGMLNAVFRGKVFEEGGNFSIDRFSLPYYPYESFTGIRLPEGDKARGMLLTDTTHTADVVTLDADGNPVDRNNVEVTLYKLRWKWWWDNTEGTVYMSDSYATELSKGTIKTTNGKGKWKFKVKYPDWGRYLVKAYDPVSGHSTAKIVYIDWPGWAGRSRGGNEGATMLSFSSDKPVYNIGEKATIMIPGSGEGRALVSVENGSRVVESYWVETSKGDTPFNFDITREMTPNVFVNVTLLQPHGQTVNDLPIRLYGIIPIRVEDPETHLEPVIEMPDVLEPGQEVIIKISEKTKRKMTYSIAVVDEGLLDLTRFRTPDPWNRFYAREALGVKTWDLYDMVMGAFGSKLERLLAVGGDDQIKGKDDDAKANRFRPVVKYLGPFTLDGGSEEHRFIMPQYIGSVKTMVVAGNEGAYGSAEKATPVRKPLMVLATLPRVLGPEEKLKLPVTLFTMEKSIKNIRVEVKASGPLQVAETSQNVTMSGSDMTIEFDLNVKSMLGVGKLEVTASSGNYTASDVIEIDVRNPNPPVTRMQEGLLAAGKTWSTNVAPAGMAGTNSGTLEVSSLPPINLGYRLKYLLQYPYGCIEQTTSSVFPQLYVDQIKTLTDGERTLIQTNVRAGIERLRSFQQRDGGFGYWPGVEGADSWSTTYAGHFLVEAEAKGYFVPNEMLKRWKKFQRNKAQDWRKNQEYYSSELIQAYRLYVLAVAGDPELGAMNKLREQGNLPATAAWMLTAAYAKAGQLEAAKKLMANLPTSIKPYQEMAYSYGSDLRDEAVILETLVLLNERAKGFDLLKNISASLSNPNSWMSTQTTAWCLKAAGAFAGTEKRGPLKFTYTYNGKDVEASTDLPIAQIELPVDGVKSPALKVASESNGTLFVRLITEGTPARGEEEELASNLNINVSYADTDGNAIDPGRLEQGTGFIATVSIHNPGARGVYKNMALNQIFPSGWEISNLRLDDAESRLGGDKPTYQDIRDDRVYTYFDIGANQRKTFQVLLTASYAGTYYLPSVSCEAMYDRTIYARKKGQVVEVVKAATQ